MKCRGVYDENAKKDMEFFIRLTNDGSEYTLRAVDVNGNTIDGGYILKISSDGLHRFSSMNENIGFPTDNDGCIQLKDY